MRFTYRAFDLGGAKSISWTQGCALRDGTSCHAPVPYAQLVDVVLVGTSPAKGSASKPDKVKVPDVRLVMLEEAPESSARVASVGARSFMPRRLGDPLELPD
jgi:hypothetical protein